MTWSPQVPDRRSPSAFMASTWAAHWSISVTSCPACVSRPPTTEPIAPEPMIPMRVTMVPPDRKSSAGGRQGRVERSLHDCLVLSPAVAEEHKQQTHVSFDPQVGAGRSAVTEPGGSAELGRRPGLATPPGFRKPQAVVRLELAGPGGRGNTLGLEGGHYPQRCRSEQLVAVELAAAQEGLTKPDQILSRGPQTPGRVAHPDPAGPVVVVQPRRVEDRHQTLGLGRHERGIAHAEWLQDGSLQVLTVVLPGQALDKLRHARER